MASVEGIVPHFFRGMTDAPAWIAAHGIPSDFVPVRNTALGRARYRDAPGQPIVTEFDCCMANRWAPLDAAIRSRNATLVLCGQRPADYFGWDRTVKGDLLESVPGVQLWYPIADWSDGGL